jgi:hypothetical protein
MDTVSIGRILLASLFSSTLLLGCTDMLARQRMQCSTLRVLQFLAKGGFIRCLSIEEVGFIGVLVYNKWVMMMIM